jgi:hypothetical protein
MCLLALPFLPVCWSYVPAFNNSRTAYLIHGTALTMTLMIEVGKWICCFFRSDFVLTRQIVLPDMQYKAYNICVTIFIMDNFLAEKFVQ